MSIRRLRIRIRILAFGQAFVLLAAQFALAAYACPLEVRAAAMAAMRAAGLPCEDRDEQQPALCHQQMAQAGQSAETAKTPVPALPDATPARGVPAPSLEGGAAGAAWAPLGAAQGPPSEPVYLATRRLRN